MNRRTFFAALAAAALAGCESLGAQDLKLEPAPPFRDPDVPYVPSRDDVVDAMLKLADVRPGDVVYDLGCGDGRIVIAAAKKFGARGVGVDINPMRISEARYNAHRAGVEKLVEFKVGDLFETDVRGATVVTLYLLPEVNQRLKPILRRDLKPGARVVSHDFSMGADWPPERTEKVGYDTIFLWTIK